MSVIVHSLLIYLRLPRRLSAQATVLSDPILSGTSFRHVLGDQVQRCGPCRS